MHHNQLRNILAALASCAAILGTSASAFAGTTCQNLWCQSSQGFNDGGFGSSYSLWAGIETKKDHASDPAYENTYFRGGADLAVTAKAFGSSKTIVEGNAIALYHQGVGTIGYELAAMGTVLYSGGVSNTISLGVSRTFFSVDDSIKLLGVKISLDAKITGELGIDVTPYFQTGAVSVAANPYAAAYTEVDASVGAACASVGVSGDLTAIDFSAPTNATCVPGSSSSFIWAHSAYDLHSLDGKLKVNLEYCLDKDSKTLVNFNGFSASGTLLNATTNIPY